MTVAEILDPEVEKKIIELKRRVGPEMKQPMREDNNLFHRFLIARDYNLDQAETMLRKHIIWRKEYNADNILSERETLTEREKELIEYFGQSIIGFDKDHCPVKYLAMGNTDWKGFRESAKWSDRFKVIIGMNEEEAELLETESKKVGRTLKGMVYIADFKNFSFSNATDKKLISELLAVLTMVQDNYPERLKQLIIINASSYFTIVFHVIKNVLASSILNKMKMYAGPEEYEPALLKIMDAEYLPAFLGGKKTDPNGDPLCKSFVRHGGPIPTKYHLPKSKNSLSKSKGVKKLTIPRAAFNEIELIVKEADSVIEWEFETKTRDIGFGLFYKEEGEEENIKELVPLQRLETDDFTETGMFKCEKPGTYILLFDNSYSWMRSKELYYKASVVSPKDHQKEMMT